MHLQKVVGISKVESSLNASIYFIALIDVYGQKQDVIILYIVFVSILSGQSSIPLNEMLPSELKMLIINEKKI